MKIICSLCNVYKSMTITLEVDFVPYYHIYRLIIDLDEENLNRNSCFSVGFGGHERIYGTRRGSIPGAFTRNLGVGILRVASHPDPLLHPPPKRRL